MEPRTAGHFRCSHVADKTMSASPRILVVDSHPLIREGLESLLMSALGEARVSGCGAFPEALRQMESNTFDLVISEFRVLGDTLLAFLDQLRASSSRTRCLIYSGGDETQIGYPCMLAGASGFVSKTEPLERVVEAARTVLDGRQYISESLARLLMRQNGSEMKPSAGIHLSRRELEVFSMIGTGLPVSKIAERLGISVKTVEAHRENIKNKLGFSNSAQVLAAAVLWTDETSVLI
jgi:DNA-binding NarL/FixJ family response regulator